MICKDSSAENPDWISEALNAPRDSANLAEFAANISMRAPTISVIILLN